MDAPSITEILDDEEEEAAAAAAAGAVDRAERSPAPIAAAIVGEDSNGEASQDVLMGTANIKMPMPGVVHIKSEPKDDGYKDDDEDDAFMDVGTIEPIDETMEEDEEQQEDRANVAGAGEEQASVEPVVVHEELSVLTVDTSEGGTQPSPETIALDSPLTPATGNVGGQQQHDSNLDGSVEMLESLDTVAPVVTIVPNKIKINISKLATASLQAEGNTDSRDSVNSAHLEGNWEGASRSRAATPEAEILYELKETMREASFRRMSTVANGIETSGLCSIM